MDLQFQHPELFIAFLAVPLLVLLVWNLFHWKKRIRKNIGDEKLVNELTKSHSQRKFLLKAVLAGLALVCVIVAVVNPQRPGIMDKVERKGVDVMIALDVSNSMMAQDIKPNRLEKAKQLINRLLPELRNDRIGLVLFAGRAYMQMPLTTDHAAARMYVQNASPLIVPSQGTMLSEALKLSTAAFNSKERKFKSIILITDGEDHDPASLEVAEQLSANGVMVNTVGIGSPTGTPIPNPATGQFRKDDQGNTILSKLNEQQLKQIAGITQGLYINSDDVSATANLIAKKLSTIQGSTLEDMAFKDYVHYFPWFAAIGMLLLLIEFVLPERRIKPKLVLLCLLWTQHSMAQETDLRKGNHLYREGKYQEAEAAYNHSYKKLPVGVTAFNLGNAYFREQKFDEAIAAYQSTLAGNIDSLKQRALYNTGVALSKQKKLEESIVAYKKAVRLDPSDEDARINLQKALLELKRKQPPKKEDEQKKKQEKQKNNQQEQPPKTNMSKKEIERLLKALQQREQQVQQKMQQSRTRSAGQQDKDW